MTDKPKPAGMRSKTWRRVGAALVVMSAIAFMGAWVAGSAMPSRGDMLAWWTAAVDKAQTPSHPGFEAVVDRVKPAVFGIRAKVIDQPAASGEGFLPGLGDQPPPKSGEVPRSILSQGSGFFISSDGYAITSNHVIDRGTEIEIETDDGTTYPATLVGSDPQSDIALIKVDGGTGFQFVEIADNAPRIGEWVLAVGNPFGLGGTVTAGIVSARARDIGPSGYNDFIQIDAPVNQGNSGGPTFDVTGKVIGVNSAIVSPTGGSVGIGFAIPAETVKSVAAQLKDKGTVIRAWIGVHIQPLTPEIADGLDLKQAQGALVTDMVPFSPAAKAGVLSGDVITSLDGEPVKDDRELVRKVSEMPPGTDVKLGIIRKGEDGLVSLTLAQLPTPRNDADASEEGLNKAPEGGTDPSSLGLTLVPGESLGANTEGVVVTEVDPDGIAAERGLQAGDVILEVAGDPVNQPSEVKKALRDAHGKSKHNVIARVRSGDSTRFVAIPVG